MNRFFLFLIIVQSSCSLEQSSNKVQSEKERWDKHAGNTEIIRDDFGVPHIYGKTDADAVFGLLYAQCEDDFRRVEQNYIWATGRLAEVEGEQALYSDLRANLFMTRDEAINYYEHSPEWLKKLCNAFADGINYYLNTHPEVKPRLLTRFEPWMPMYFSEGSIGGDIERISIQRIRDFYDQDTTKLLGLTKDELNPQGDKEPRGSNGIAISGKLTESGNAMLLINPHTSFFFRGEVHVVSEEGLNAYGAVTWGQFFVYQGFNEKTGWMHTSTYTDVMDEFAETITKSGDEDLYYKYGDELLPIKSLNVSLSFVEEDALREKTFTIYRTHHGAITHTIDGQWIATAMMWDPVMALTQSFTRTKLSGHKEFREMMNIRTNSSNNTVYADAEGNIAYYHGNFIPRRDTTFDYTQVLAGSDPATDWQGIHEVSESITVINPENGWIQNCNSTPFTSAGMNSPKKEDYPKYMSVNRENFRGIHATRLLKKANELTIDKVIEVAYDPYLSAFEELVPGLVSAIDQVGDTNVDLAEARKILDDWDFTVSKESVAMSLAHFYAIRYLQEGRAPEGLTFMDKIDYFSTKSLAAERLEVFRKTLAQLKEDFGTWKTPWGEINRYQRINGEITQPFNDNLESIPIGLASGRWGALASFGARAYNTKRIYGTSGNSFVAVVEFGDKLKAKSLLAGGQSGNPASPHFDDQAQRYADVQFKDVAYYREDVLKRAKSTYHPGKEKK